jgi:DNA primase
MVSRRPEAYFFGTSSAIHSVWSSKEVWITEGPVDQLTIERLITPNVLALTTNSVNRQQKKFLDRFIDLVYSCLDLDGAGRSGFKKLLCSDRDFEIRDVKYKRLGFDSKDVNDLWKKIGDDKFKSHLLSCI